VVVTDPRFPDGGTFEGRDAIRGFYERLRQGWEDGTYVDLHDLREVGERVLGDFTWRGTGETSGVQASIDVTCVWTIRDGLITRAEFFFDRNGAMKAAGVSRES